MAIRSVPLAPIGFAVLGSAGVTVIWVVGGPAPVGWLAAVAYLAASNALLLLALRRRRMQHLGWANAVTAVRSTLAGVVTGLVAASFVAPISVPLLIGLVVPALVLDAVDGWVARSTGTTTEIGARFDAEVDGVLFLVLSAYVARILGPWVLAIGLMPYAFVVAGWMLPWLRRPLPLRYWRKTIGTFPGIALTLAASGLAPAFAGVLTVCALALLVGSFGHDVAWLSRRRRR